MNEKNTIGKKMTRSVIRNVKTQKVPSQRKKIINADLVPKVSQKIASPVPMGTKIISPKIPASPSRVVQAPKIPASPSRVVQAPKGYIAPAGKYGKMDSLIKDPSVTYIECPGAGKNIIIIRSGQKQITKIVLTPKEIDELLKKMAEDARVPLLEGVFRAAIQNFIVNAVVSKVIGSRFVIKKQTPYSLLQVQGRPVLRAAPRPIPKPSPAVKPAPLKPMPPKVSSKSTLPKSGVLSKGSIPRPGGR